MHLLALLGPLPQTMIMTDLPTLPTLSYFSTSEISTLLGGASLYRPLYKEYKLPPPALAQATPP